MADRDKPPRDGDKPPRRSSAKSSSGGRPSGGRPSGAAGGDRPSGGRASGGRPGGSRPSQGRPTGKAPSVVVPRVVRPVVGHLGHGRPEANRMALSRKVSPTVDLTGTIGLVAKAAIRHRTAMRRRRVTARHTTGPPTIVREDRGRPVMRRARRVIDRARPATARPATARRTTGRRAIGPEAGRRDRDRPTRASTAGLRLTDRGRQRTDRGRRRTDSGHRRTEPARQATALDPSSDSARLVPWSARCMRRDRSANRPRACSAKTRS